MSKKFISLGLALVLVVAALALVGCASEKKAETPATPAAEAPAANPAFANLIKGDGKTILVGTDAPYPPMEMVKEDGTFEGFDIDIYNAIAEKIGAQVEFKTFGFDPIIASLSADTKEFDSSITSMTITEDRKKNILFSDPYFDAMQALSVTTDSPIKTTADLKKGMKVAVQLGTTGEIWAKKNIVSQGVELKAYDQVPGCFGALQAGDVDAVICDAQVAGDYAKDATRKVTVVERITTNELYGIAFSKSNQALLDEVNKGLKAIKDDGTYAKIYEKWFGIAPPSIP